MLLLEAMEMWTPSEAASLATPAPIPEDPPKMRIDCPLIEGMVMEVWICDG